MVALFAMTFNSYADSHMNHSNRYAAGKFNINSAKLIKVKLKHKPERLTISDEDGKPAIYTASGDGRVFKTAISSGKAETISTNLSTNIHAQLYINKAPTDASMYSAPKKTPFGTVYINLKGELVTPSKKYPINALHDNEIAVYGRYAVVLTGSTRDYAHGVLGDSVEAKGFAVIDLQAERVLTRKDVSSMGVIEQKGALLADLSGDSIPEITLTISNSSTGARVVSFALYGENLYIGSPIGKGFRWRHVFAAGKFEDGIKIVNVVTPHIGGTLELLTPSRGKLVRTASASAFSSHSIGSANLGMGLVMDATGDGKPEIFVPDTSKENIEIVAFRGNSASIINRIKLGSKLSTEIDTMITGIGRVLAFGTSSKEILIYISE